MAWFRMRVTIRPADASSTAGQRQPRDYSFGRGGAKQAIMQSSFSSVTRRDSSVFFVTTILCHIVPLLNRTTTAFGCCPSFSHVSSSQKTTQCTHFFPPFTFYFDHIRKNFVFSTGPDEDEDELCLSD